MLMYMIYMFVPHDHSFSGALLTWVYLVLGLCWSAPAVESSTEVTSTGMGTRRWRALCMWKFDMSGRG